MLKIYYRLWDELSCQWLVFVGCACCPVLCCLQALLSTVQFKISVTRQFQFGQVVSYSSNYKVSGGWNLLMTCLFVSVGWSDHQVVGLCRLLAIEYWLILFFPPKTSWEAHSLNLYWKRIHSRGFLNCNILILYLSISACNADVRTLSVRVLAGNDSATRCIDIFVFCAWDYEIPEFFQ